MPEPFKSWFRPEVAQQIGARFAAVDPHFDLARYEALALPGLEALELKGRVRHLSAALRAALPAAWPAALERVLAVMDPPLPNAEAVSGPVWHWPLLQLVEDHGLGHPEASLAALAELTRRFSAEFAVRPYLEQHPALAWTTLHRLAQEGDVHQRRLASEGSRPRLPWGRRLRALVADPSPGLALITTLRDDPEAYVRRSVANHLNDVAKDHPERVVALAATWLDGAPPPRARLVRHALRHLVKQGHPGALGLLGAGGAAVELLGFTLGAEAVAIGGSLPLEVVLHNPGPEATRVVLDYQLLFPRARGGHSPRVFKWAVLDLAPGERRALRREHPLRPVTTRPTRPGLHGVAVQVNGQALARREFTLLEPPPPAPPPPGSA